MSRLTRKITKYINNLSIYTKIQIYNTCGIVFSCSGLISTYESFFIYSTISNIFMGIVSLPIYVGGIVIFTSSCIELIKEQYTTHNKTIANSPNINDVNECANPPDINDIANSTCIAAQ